MIYVPLTVKDKEAAFAVVLMTSDSQLGMRDTEDRCDDLCHPKRKKKQPWQEVTGENA